MSILTHVANALFLAAYVVKDILWLRVLSVVATVCLLISVVGKEWGEFGWNSVFLLINLVQIVVLVLERRPVQLTDDEAKLYDLAFHPLRPRDFKKLVGLGTWEDKRDGDALARVGTALDRVVVVLRGHAIAMKNGDVVVEFGPGKFVGETAFFSGARPAADVTCDAPTRLMAWRLDVLKEFVRQNPDLGAAIHVAMGKDLAAKLSAAVASRADAGEIAGAS